jgi:hypothetical protein
MCQNYYVIMLDAQICIRIDITSPHRVRQKYEVLKPVLIYKPWSKGLVL